MNRFNCRKKIVNTQISIKSLKSIQLTSLLKKILDKGLKKAMTVVLSYQPKRVKY